MYMSTNNKIIILGDERLTSVLSTEEQQSLINIVDRLALNGIELKPVYLATSAGSQSSSPDHLENRL
jgi:hypothetical protein